MQIVKQELDDSEYIRSVECPIDRGIKIQNYNDYSGNRQYQDLAFSYFYGHCFPFWQPMSINAGGYDQWQTYQQSAMISSPTLIKQETAFYHPVFAQKPAETSLVSGVCPPAASSSSVSPRSSPQKAQRRRRFNSFFWTLEENRRYLKFIRKNSDLFLLSTIQKKCLKVNVLMSFTVKSRNGQQCHSHHQKLMKKYGSIKAILDNFEKDMAEERRKYRKRSKKDESMEIDQLKNESSKIEDKEKMQEL